jgi:DNA-binding MarR family transcriptional regulator/GNAT superfamily N-acetyltransferase
MFEPKWFPVFYYLSKRGPSPVTDIGRGLGITHPSVNQIAKEMMQAGLVAAYKDTKDKRKRVLALTALAKQHQSELQNVWKDVSGALQELLDETQVDFLGYVETIERALDKKSFHERFMERHKPESNTIVISTFQPQYEADFRRINEAWIVEYFELEDMDRKALDHPMEHIIEPGGDIIFGIDRDTGKVLGTCAIINRGNGVGELAKMGVDKAARGKGFGKVLAHASIKRARELGFERLYLETNTRLAPALGLYKSLGFIRKPSPWNSDYSRADVYMELDLGL